MFEKLTGRTPDIIDKELYQKFAVLVPYLPKSKELLFQVRSHELHRQPGEICFPGGLVEKFELTSMAAVREATEELLISESSIQVIAPLDILITPYNTMIYPYLAYLTNYDYTFSTDEVHEVFTVPFDFFMQEEPLTYQNQVVVSTADPNFPYDLLGVETYPWSKAQYPVLFYQYQNWVIWGLTAKIVRNLVLLYRAPSPERYFLFD